MTGARTAFRLASALAIASATLAAPAAQACDTVEAAQDEGERLRALMAQSDAASLQRNPTSAFYRGEFSQAGKLGDFSPAYYETERAAAVCNIASLATIDRAALDAGEQIAYDTFRYANERTLAATEGEVLQVILATPIDHFRGIQGSYPSLSATDGIMPFETVEDYANNISRHEAYAQMVEDVIARFDTGIEQGITLPRLTVELMIEQLDTQLATPEEDNPYYAPLRALPEDFTDAEKGQATAALTAAIEGTLYPAMRRLRTYLSDTYLPAARTSIGATETPGGDAYYSYRIAEMTTLPLTAEEVHRIGLAEVERINVARRQAIEERGDRRPPVYKTKEALTEAWYEVGEKVDAVIGPLFLRQPETPLEIKPYEPYREEFFLAASYQPGKPDGTRPGTFYFSGWNAAERELSPSVRLYIHEGNPGHHFQVMFAIEDESLPDLLRHGWYTAYGEGWALYAESLGYELGLYDDPVDRLQALEDGELKRAVRLVVDTGMHALGWTREQAVEYMVENGNPRDYSENEVARYIAMPAQALGYKIGELKIKELRARAEEALGEDFDIRVFHDQVLNSGNIPLAVLEAKIDAWIAAGGQ
ncbi:DUF885 domain-containing protein [Qipengyuania flava]|uniref:DUF885 domain-containing protein n=1 Tax=Qipengyuania flava TaxID=192812 RepID=UPI001C638D1E|nr:DUF885 domain-containing protein [Qipengyuania flava]QYJ07035.1 DUF885 domain-containing protein [Qipengyuania flava]